MTVVAWNAETCATWLFERQAQLVRELPTVIDVARGLNTQQRHDVVTDAIVTTSGYAVDPDPDRAPIRDADELRRVFWSCCRHHAMQELEGRHATVRGGFARADDAELDRLTDDATPADAVHALDERRLVAEFASTLDGDVAAAFRRQVRQR